MPGQRSIDDFASPDKPIPVHDFAEALRAQAISAGHADTIKDVNDVKIVQNFFTNIAPNLPKWKPLVDAKSLNFQMQEAAPSGPPATSQAPAQAPGPPPTQAQPGLEERLKKTAEGGPDANKPRMIGHPGPFSLKGAAAATVRPLLHPFTNPLETLGYGSLRGWQEEKHAAKRAEVGVEGGLAPGQIEQGNIDLKNRPAVKNADGSSSTVSTMTIEEDGKTILLPTVINGKRVSEGAAREHYQQTGEHMGIFRSEKDADEYDKQLHNKMGWKGAPGSDQEKWQDSARGAPVSKAERFADQAMEEIAGLGDALVSPVGLLTAGFGPAIRAATKAQGVGRVMRGLKWTERAMRLGFGGSQLIKGSQSFMDFLKDPTPENAAKATADLGIGATAVAPEAIGVGKGIGRAAKTGADIVRNPLRIPEAVKAGASGFARGYRGEATDTPPQAQPAEAPKAAPAEPTGPPERAAATPEPEAAPAQPKRARSTAGSTKKAEPNLVERTRAAKDEPTRAEPIVDRGPSLPKGLGAEEPKYQSHSLLFTTDVDRAAYEISGPRPSPKRAQYLKFLKEEADLTEPQAEMWGNRIRGYIGGEAKGRKTPGSIEIPPHIDFKALKGMAKTSPTTAAATSKEPVKLAGETAAKALDYSEASGLKNYRGLLKEPSLANKSVSISVPELGDNVPAIPVGGSRKSGTFDYLPDDPQEAASIVKQLRGKPGFPNVTSTQTQGGYEISWGEPIPKGITQAELGKRFGYSDRAIKEFSEPTRQQANKVSDLIKQGKLDEAVKRLQKDSNLAPAEARKRVWSAKAALDKRAAAEKPKAAPARERPPLTPPVKVAEPTSGSRRAVEAPKITPELESEARKILSEDGQEEATKFLRIKTGIELPKVREIVKNYASSPPEAPAAEPTGPPTPRTEIPREQVAARAADDVIEQSRGGREEHQFPLYLELQDANGRMISTTAAQTPEMLESVHKHLAEDIAANPEVARVQWKSGKEKGVSFVDKHRRDIIRESQERPAGTFIPNGGSR